MDTTITYKMTRYFSLALSAMLVALSAHAQQSTPATQWFEKLQLASEVRLRHDYNSKEAATNTSESHKEHFRVRFSIMSNINENLKAKVRLSTAKDQSSNSTNQPMTDNANKKGIYIDIAMLDWKLCDSSNLLLGKIENPLRPVSASQLMYDVDYSPEGAALTNKYGNIFVNAAGFVTQERAPQSTTSGTSEPDSWMLGGVAGYKADINEKMGLTVAAGYHNFTALKKNAALTPGFSGNSNTGSRYDHDYQVGELAAELKLKMSERSLTFFTDMIHNFYIEEDNQGLLAGLQYSTLVDGKPDWSFMYAYQGLDKDATVSAINYSDWGNGNDGGFGHMGQVSKTINTNVSAALTWHHMNIDNNGNPYSSERAFADLTVTF